MLSPDATGAATSGTGAGTSASTPASGASGGKLLNDQVQEKLKSKENCLQKSTDQTTIEKIYPSGNLTL